MVEWCTPQSTLVYLIIDTLFQYLGTVTASRYPNTVVFYIKCFFDVYDFVITSKLLSIIVSCALIG